MNYLFIRIKNQLPLIYRLSQNILVKLASKFLAVNTDTKRQLLFNKQ